MTTKKPPPWWPKPDDGPRRWVQPRGHKWWPDSWKKWKDKQPMRRTRSFKQKPWNKVPRADKYWVPSRYLVDGGTNFVVVNNNDAQFAYYVNGEEAAGRDSGGASAAMPRALQHAKLHRFQGNLFAWLDPSTNSGESEVFNDGNLGGSQMPPNLELLTYVWRYYDEASNLPSLNAVLPLTNNNPGWNADLPNMLMRDDVISWGTIPVWGIHARMLHYIGKVVGGAAEFASHVEGLYPATKVASIPWPRVPKAGFSLKKGRGLACIVARTYGPTSSTSTAWDPPESERDIIITDVSRTLMSAD